MQNEIEVMRVFRTPPMGALIVQTGGQRVKQLSTIEDEATRRRILAAIGELIAFAGGYDVLLREGVAPPLPASAEEAEAPQERGEELTGEQAAFLDQLEKELKATITPTRLDPLDEIDIERLELEEPIGQEDNLVFEIDRILQRHIAADEQIAHRNVHLRQLPGQILQIIVDDVVYEHPNQIEDQRVRSALKNALKEWESR